MMVAPRIPHSNRPTPVLGDPRIPFPFAPRELSLSVRPERSGTANTTSKRPSAEVVLTAPRSRRACPEGSRRAGSLRAPHAAPGAAFPRKSPSKEPRSKCHTVTFLQLRKCHKCHNAPKSVTFPDTKKCHTIFVSGQLGKCHKCHNFQLRKKYFSYKPCDIVTFQQGVCPWKM